MEWAFLVVGMLLVAAIWDIGRRYVDKIAVRDVGFELLDMKATLNGRIDGLRVDVDGLAELREDVAGHGTEIRGLKSGLEGMRAQRSRPGWPLRQ